MDSTTGEQVEIAQCAPIYKDNKDNCCLEVRNVLLKLNVANFEIGIDSIEWTKILSAHDFSSLLLAEILIVWYNSTAYFVL